MALTFRGGAHPPVHKHTAGLPIVPLPPPAIVSVPLSQHIGKHCTPLVAIGDVVKKGQKIGEVEGLGAPVHASISGKVIDIRCRRLASGRNVDEIVIENDGTDTLAETVKPIDRDIADLTIEDVIAFVREAGITGMGGAAFPTYAKIESARGKAKHLVVNCAECEPYITADHRTLMERPEDVVRGMKILLSALGIPRGILAIEDNKRDAAEQIDTLYHDDDTVEIRLLKTKYPQGDERQIIYALSGIELPAGKLPADVGFVVFNAETCAAVYRAYIDGMPAISRVVTVGGDCVREPKNLLVPIGTSYRELIDFCGGLVRSPRKILCGGPMMGKSIWDLDSPVAKGTSALLCLSGAEDPSYRKNAVCIRCGRCVAGCPMHLMPSYLAQFSKQKNDAACEKFDVFSCVECGTCTYLCPGNVPIVQYIRVAKERILDTRRANQEAKESARKNS